MMKYIFLGIIGTFVFNVFGQDRITGRPFATRSEVIARHGMAATSQPLATQVALDILKQGGTAVDAAIAANAMLGLVEPMSCGIGGDLFVIIWDAKSEKLYGLNASGRSPRSLTLADLKEMDLDRIPIRGPLPVTVPGCVDGWFEMQRKFGKLSMAKILAPTIRYAREGFPVTEIIADQWQQSAQSLAKFTGFRQIYLINGVAPHKGQIFQNPVLANTLEIIAQKGRDGFYRGEVAEKISACVVEAGGFLQPEDLAAHTSEWVEPLSVNYRGYDVWELPPNGQGIAVLQMLNILEGYDLRSWGFGSAEYLHHLIEAKKLVYEDRAKFYADPQFNQIPIQQLLSKSYAAERRKQIRPDRAATSYSAGVLPSGDTVYLTVADSEGNMVSLIQSIYWGFGSGLVPEELGFALQNRGALFSLDQEHFNCYAPGKRPFHTIIPGFISKDGKPFVSFGVMGGSMQPQGHVQIIVNLIDFGMNLQEAGDAPRIRHTGSSQPTGEKMSGGGEVHCESGIPFETVRELARRGHRLGNPVISYGGYQAILFDRINRVYYGASESRKDGQAAGY
ncbi:MAG: gamma-glutamyltransferase [Calditrichia bacterium]